MPPEHVHRIVADRGDMSSKRHDADKRVYLSALKAFLVKTSTPSIAQMSKATPARIIMLKVVLDALRFETKNSC